MAGDMKRYRKMEYADKLGRFAPPYMAAELLPEEADLLAPFFTNLDRPVYVPLIAAPEVIGALCSRASRAAGDLRTIFLREYVLPFLRPVRGERESEEAWQARRRYGEELAAYIGFLHGHAVEEIFSHPRARAFYSKWLAQYGDDSIAQMAGTHVVFAGLSQLAIKHFEDQRVGLAPIEKSTRYVNFGEKLGGNFRYYTDPRLSGWGLTEAYRQAMDALFTTYRELMPRLSSYLQQRFPEEKVPVIEKKAFDTLRGLLPVATLSQVAFFGNGQAFEYLIARSARHRLGEVRWAAEEARRELARVVPSFLRRLTDPAARATAETYQEYLAGRQERMAAVALQAGLPAWPEVSSAPAVRLLEYDPEGEEKVIAGMLYDAPATAAPWDQVLVAVRAMGAAQRRAAVEQYLKGRTQRWQKVGRAFEHAYVRFEIEMDIGAWRDLHRHRMLTQQRQVFGCGLGYTVPPDAAAAGLAEPYGTALERAVAVWERLAEHDAVVAQYAVPMAFRVRFQQWVNLRQCFWEMELRTIPEGHPDYRYIEQEKFRLLAAAYPLLTAYMRVNTGQYDFARRGQEEKIQEKLRSLERVQAAL